VRAVLVDLYGWLQASLSVPLLSASFRTVFSLWACKVAAKSLISLEIFRKRHVARWLFAGTVQKSGIKW
jgi:hypothetical protein